MVLSGRAHYRYQDKTVRLEQGQTVLLPACWGGSIETDEQMCVLITKPGVKLEA